MPNKDELTEEEVSVGLQGNGNVIVRFEGSKQAVTLDPDSGLRLACAIADASIAGGANMGILIEMMARDFPKQPPVAMDA